MLVVAGFTTEDAHRQINVTHRIPDDPDEYRALLESMGFPPDDAAWEVNRDALVRELEDMLGEPGFSADAARSAMHGLLVEHSERGVVKRLTPPNLDEKANGSSAWEHQPRWRMRSAPDSSTRRPRGLTRSSSAAFHHLALRCPRSQSYAPLRPLTEWCADSNRPGSPTRHRSRSISSCGR